MTRVNKKKGRISAKEEGRSRESKTDTRRRSVSNSNLADDKRTRAVSPTKEPEELAPSLGSCMKCGKQTRFRRFRDGARLCEKCFIMMNAYTFHMLWMEHDGDRKME